MVLPPKTLSITEQNCRLLVVRMVAPVAVAELIGIFVIIIVVFIVVAEERWIKMHGAART